MQPPVKIEKQRVVYIRNTDLAACLLAVGCTLRDDPPYTAQRFGDKLVIQYAFNEMSACGKYHTKDLAAAYSRDADFLAQEPEHPFAYAMCAIKNKYSLKQHMEKDARPYVAFKTEGNSTIWVVEGSERFRKCVSRGLRRVPIPQNLIPYAE